jgi:SAM-dependent methyltransferase
MVPVPHLHRRRQTRAVSVERYGFLHDPDSRRERGRRIVAALRDFGNVDIESSRVLDIGCSAGIVTREIARSARFVAGIDIDEAALEFAGRSGGTAHFAAASGDRLPFPDHSFDAVVCNHVYEHVPDASALMREIARVLRLGGACYFAAGHVLQLVEPHYRLPLLSWLPRSLAGAWLRALGRAPSYDERFVLPWHLPRLFLPFASARFVSPAMLRDPGRYGFAKLARMPAAARAMLGVAGPLVARAAPTYIYVLKR